MDTLTAVSTMSIHAFCRPDRGNDMRWEARKENRQTMRKLCPSILFSEGPRSTTDIRRKEILWVKQLHLFRQAKRPCLSQQIHARYAVTRCASTITRLGSTICFLPKRSPTWLNASSRASGARNDAAFKRQRNQKRSRRPGIT